MVLVGRGLRAQVVVGEEPGPIHAMVVGMVGVPGSQVSTRTQVIGLAVVGCVGVLSTVVGARRARTEGGQLAGVQELVRGRPEVVSVVFTVWSVIGAHCYVPISAAHDSRAAHAALTGG